MKVFIVGGTGLLGSASAAELIRRGHQVTAIALPPIPIGAVFPEGMQIQFGNYLEMSDGDLETLMSGCDALVFAAGIDERVEFPPPVYEQFRKYNVAPVERLLRIGRKVGLKRAVIMGSYFAHFAKLWPHLRLSKRHPYIRSRLQQEEVALSFNSVVMQVMVLEIPYVFGAQPGRKPVWTILIEQIQKMKWCTFYPKGGTAMVTDKQVGQAVSGALEMGIGGTCYPLGWFNLKWIDLISLFHRYMGMPGRKIVTIPNFLFRCIGLMFMFNYWRRGIEPGLHMMHFTDIQTADTFIDSAKAQELGVSEDDLEKAIAQSVLLSVEALSGKTKLMDMKFE